MKLVGKKLYRTGPLKCYKQDGGPGWMTDIWKERQKKKWEEEQKKRKNARMGGYG